MRTLQDPNIKKCKKNAYVSSSRDLGGMVTMTFYGKLIKEKIK